VIYFPPHVNRKSIQVNRLQALFAVVFAARFVRRLFVLVFYTDRMSGECAIFPFGHADLKQIIGGEPKL